jgi:hypothetical protein
MSRKSKQLTQEAVPKKKSGRPATGNDPMIAFRMPVEFKAEIDAWAAQQDDKPPRSEAMRRLMKIGLAAGAGTTKASTGPQPRRTAKRGVTGL